MTDAQKAIQQNQELLKKIEKDSNNYWKNVNEHLAKAKEAQVKK